MSPQFKSKAQQADEAKLFARIDQAIAGWGTDPTDDDPALSSPEAQKLLAAAEAADEKFYRDQADAELWRSKVASDEAEDRVPAPTPAPAPKPSAIDRLASLPAEELAVKVQDIRAKLPALVAKYPARHDANGQAKDSKPVADAKAALVALQELTFAAESREQSVALQTASSQNAQVRARAQIERTVSEGRKRVEQQALALREVGRELQNLTPLTSAGTEQNRQADELLRAFEAAHTPERIEQAVTARATEIAAQVEASVGRTHHVDAHSIISDAPTRARTTALSDGERALKKRALGKGDDVTDADRQAAAAALDAARPDWRERS